MPKTIDSYMNKLGNVRRVAAYPDLHKPEEILAALKDANELLTDVSDRLSLIRAAASWDNTLREAIDFAEV